MFVQQNGRVIPCVGNAYVVGVIEEKGPSVGSVANDFIFAQQLKKQHADCKPFDNSSLRTHFRNVLFRFRLLLGGQQTEQCFSIVNDFSDAQKPFVVNNLFANQHFIPLHFWVE